ncbi:MAG: hypothetical protein QOH59_2940 [Gemmatimonadales bacterium]|nr:hypothetical protein [Gemmatimonadales bacterium]
MIIPLDLVRLPRALYIAAAAFAFAGLALRVAPARLPQGRSALTIQTTTRLSSAETIHGDERSYAPIAATNVFSQGRTPPKIRFVPEGREEQVEAPPPPRRRESLLRLYGVTVRADGAIALIDADPRVPGAELYRLGDRVAGSPIVAITESTVVIRRAGKPVTLRLRSTDRRRP